MMTDEQRARWRQPTPAMQLREVVMALEGHLSNREDKIITERAFQEKARPLLEEIKALYPHLDVGAWLDWGSGGSITNDPNAEVKL